MARLTKDDWIKEGFKILSEFAQNKLRILYLCQRLKVTRGSFYHHFKSIEEYITALMETWQEDNTLKLIRHSNVSNDPNEKMQILTKEIAMSDQRVEAAIRSWSYYHPIVKQKLQKVDEIRVAFLQSVFEQLGFEKELAYKKGMIDYAILIGMQQLNPDLSPAEQQEFFELSYHPEK